VTSVLLRDSAVSLDIFSLNSRVYSRLESNVDSVIIRVSDHQSSISSLNSRIYSKLESNVSSIINRVATNELGISSLGTRLSGAESNISSVIVRVSTVESDISIIRNTVYTIFDGKPTDPNYSTLQLINAELLTDINDYNVEAIESRISYLETVIRKLTQPIN
jgi:hypothetical protein